MNRHEKGGFCLSKEINLLSNPKHMTTLALNNKVLLVVMVGLGEMVLHIFLNAWGLTEFALVIKAVLIIFEAFENMKNPNLA